MKYPKLYVEVVLLDSMKGNVLVENKYFQNNKQGLSEWKHPIFNKKDNGQQQLGTKRYFENVSGVLIK